MKRVVRLSASLALMSGVLAACAVNEEVVVDIQPEEEVVTEVTSEPELPSLLFRWPLDSGTLISPPITIQTKAIEACRQRGFDISFMIQIGIDGDDAVAQFGCRGAD